LKSLGRSLEYNKKLEKTAPHDMTMSKNVIVISKEVALVLDSSDIEVSWVIKV